MEGKGRRSREPTLSEGGSPPQSRTHKTLRRPPIKQADGDRARWELTESGREESGEGSRRRAGRGGGGSGGLQLWDGKPFKFKEERARPGPAQRERNDGAYQARWEGEQP